MDDLSADQQKLFGNLVRKRGVIKGQLSRFENFLNVFTTDKAIELPSRIEKCKQWWDDFEAVQGEIESLIDSDIQAKERIEFQEKYFKVISLANNQLKIISSANQSNSQQLESPHCSHHIEKNVKLPTMEIPTFHGSYKGWLEFYDVFNALIHTNSSLTNVQRFYYLKNAVKGPAYEVISTLEVSDANYEEAWKLLRTRYENKKLIALSHIESLYNFTQINKESGEQLRKLLDTVRKDLRALKTLGLEVDKWDVLLIYLLEMKLDLVTKREWQREGSIDKFSTLDQFLGFLEHRCQFLQAVDASKTGNKVTVSEIRSKPGTSRAFVATTKGCNLCEGNHALYSCKKFIGMPTAAKREQVKRLKVCWNCLRYGHVVSDCKLNGCKYCGKRHNSLLHERSYNKEESELVKASTQGSTNTHGALKQEVAGSSGQEGANSRVSQSQGLEQVSSRNRDSNVQSFKTTMSEVSTNLNENQHFTDQGGSQVGSEVLLSTALVSVVGKFGKSVLCRALLDSGSQSNFISKELVESIQLPTQKVSVTVKGLGQSVTRVNNMANATVISRTNSFQFNTSFLILDRISYGLPETSFDTNRICIPRNVTLADPSFGRSGKIDMLLGATVFWDLLCVGQIKLQETNLTIQKTKLGWVVSGQVAAAVSSFLAKGQVCNIAVNLTVQQQLERFWTLEECVKQVNLSKEHQDCERIFENTSVRNSDGRFIVTLPMKQQVNDLGDSYLSALKRFHQLERRLEKNKDLRVQYNEFIREYLELGHMSRVLDGGAREGLVYYLPHHGVFKADSSTTKLRVVFDGSAKTDLGISLNDILMVGPKLQDDLFAILLRFRKFRVVISADIAKMYRQVLVREDQRDLQRILWRFSADEELAVYRLNTVTYGTASASYLAIKCLCRLGEDCIGEFPDASQAILKGFYVDDLLYGGASVGEVRRLKSELSQILTGAGFLLRKWASNNPEVLKDENDNNQEIDHYFAEGRHVTSTLGVLWNSQDDILHFRINIDLNQTRVTKRTILSTIAQIFDPMGLVAPVVIRAKLMMQWLWKLNLSWDESVPLDIHSTWSAFRDQIGSLSELKIVRNVLCYDPVEIELHCFTDASEVAYGTAVYIRSTDSEGKHHIHLLCAKSRVAPLKVISLPRLELCGALLGARLVKEVVRCMGLKFSQIYFWCDSTIALGWINSSSSQWQVFVGNRVSEIQELSAGSTWSHIGSNENPADVVSRGIGPQQLGSCELWWNGPHWLSLDKDHWPKSKVRHDQDLPEGRIKRQVFSAGVEGGLDITSRFSSFGRLRRVTAYCLRFVNNCSASAGCRSSGSLSVEELHRAEIHLIKLDQHREFGVEIRALRQSLPIPSSSRLLPLNPFLDQEGTVRLGGRLESANLSFQQKHPIILPARSHLVELIIKHEHLRRLHAGPQALLAIIRLQYWPLGGQRSVSRVLRKCIVCFRVRPVEHEYLMGNLPKERVTPSRPFANVGVDYCGPFELKISKLRGQRVIKGYLCIFVCLATKAVHFELVNDLSTESFLNCFKRFIARRGLCKNIFSDNGTNFVGARNELQELYSFLKRSDSQRSFSEYFSGMRVSWKFIPPRSPHFGGIWEAAVRSAKYHLKRVIGNERLRYDEFNTVITQVESCLNSRPLIPLTSNPQDLEVLTPGHFLVGSSLAALPQEDLKDENPNRLTRYRHLTQLVQHFWGRWSREYLSKLQQRGKWRSETAALKPGQLVVIKEDNLPPLKWQLGRIEQVFPGSDDIVRVASVKTAKGIFKRAATKLCILPIDSD